MKLDTAANVLAKIGNPTRLRIVRLLVRAGDEGLPVGVVTDANGQDVPAPHSAWVCPPMVASLVLLPHADTAPGTQEIPIPG